MKMVEIVASWPQKIESWEEMEQWWLMFIASTLHFIWPESNEFTVFKRPQLHLKNVTFKKSCIWKNVAIQRNCIGKMVHLEKCHNWKNVAINNCLGKMSHLKTLHPKNVVFNVAAYAVMRCVYPQILYIPLAYR